MQDRQSNVEIAHVVSYRSKDVPLPNVNVSCVIKSYLSHFSTVFNQKKNVKLIADRR